MIYVYDIHYSEPLNFALSGVLPPPPYNTLTPPV